MDHRHLTDEELEQRREELRRQLSDLDERDPDARDRRDALATEYHDVDRQLAQNREAR